MEIEVDLSYLLFFGYFCFFIFVFQWGIIVYCFISNWYVMFVVYVEFFLISGYVWLEYECKLVGVVVVIVSGIGQGWVICLFFDFNFWVFWYGINCIFVNVFFFSDVISGSVVEWVSGKLNGWQFKLLNLINSNNYEGYISLILFFVFVVIGC